MNDDRAPSALSRRDLFRMIGITAGSAMRSLPST